MAAPGSIPAASQSKPLDPKQDETKAGKPEVETKAPVGKAESKPEPRTPIGYRVLEAKKIPVRRGPVCQFNAGKVLLLRAFGDAQIAEFKSAGLKLEPVYSLEN